MTTSAPLKRLAAMAAIGSVLGAGALAPGAQARAVATSTAPTVSTPTVFKPGDTTPVDIAGNDLRAGDTIRKGTLLLRFKVTMHGMTDTPVALRAPKGYIHVGLGLNKARTIGFAVAKGSSYYHRTIKVRVYPLDADEAETAAGHIYALVKKNG